MHGLLLNRETTRRYAVLLASLFLAPLAALADSTACPVDSTSLECRLLGFLHWLEAAALILIVLLVVVIGVAIHLFRKNRLSRRGGR